MLPQLLLLSLAVAPNLVTGALFPKNSQVKMIGHKEFKAAMKENMTSVVAFIAPWCGHCQKMAPEYSKAALGLHPLIPMYAVDCDDATNKRLCADQGVKGFPTVKLYPRGKQMKPIEFDGPQRSASEFYYFAQRGIPNKIKKVHYIEDLEGQINDKKIMKRHRALLMKKTNKMPLLWSTLANKYGDDMEFFSHRDRRGKSSVKLGFEKGEDGDSKVLIWPAGETKPRQFMGILKHDSLSRFFDSLLDGSANFDELNAAAAAEEFIPDPEQLEIERQQEAEMLKLAHGGFADMIDFEKAVKEGSAKDFHGKNGYPGMMGGAPSAGKKAEGQKEDAKSQETSSSSSKSKKVRMPMTDEAGQVVMDANVGPAAGSATATATEAVSEAATETPAETPEAASEPEPEVEAEPEPEAETVAAEKVDAEERSAPAPEPPVEPSAETAEEHEEHVKDEL
ncbi:uncharacterized protein FOMMEDRAFT_112230 [Fomitiporia mediterranea MF3/22]|uniref:uncharacterized protein n=1 Tax=Fomitiporia mediterranea (strain MF3/22) TaxID=694068 RepID=UPI0004409155|nr:uncharacterized protein FOMMEDRAFT_112230 [Fomitiporia mediterranea MF3/22]EJC99936.1 hypothetical protein FOMMEDRAFT_112230 [Fomitiporia mediterranea MF3/22]